MLNHKYYTSKENVRFASIIFLAICSYIFPTSGFILLMLLWGCALLIIGNVKRIYSENIFVYSLRMSLYFIPYLSPLLCTPLKIEWTSSKIVYVFFSIVVFVFWTLINRKKLKILLSPNYYSLSNHYRRRTIILRIWCTIGSAIAEEIFFRQFILSLNCPIPLLLGISIFFFIISHWTLPWGNNFTKEDFINQLVIGTSSALLFLLSGSVLPCIVLHLLFNSVHVINLVKVYYLSFVKKRVSFEGIQFPELEI